MKKLRIAQIAPPFISVPPANYGGTEAVVSNITEELVKRGHDVTLYASGGSKTSAKLVSPFPSPLSPDETEKLFSPLASKLFWTHSLPYMYHVSRAMEHAGSFDIIHDHTHYMSVFYRDFIPTPIVSTYHGSLQWAAQSPIEKMILEKYKEHNWVSISQAQQNYSGVKLHISSVIHHGIHPEQFAFRSEAEDQFVWLGRITQQKGIEDALIASTRTNSRLTVSGIVNPRDESFFSTVIKPYFTHPNITHAGPADHTAKQTLLGNARALLYPIQWEEPFGLVMIEAMACGTPVIAYARGAAPEIVEDGVSGYLINASAQDVRGDFVTKKTGIDGLIEAIQKIQALSPAEYQKMRHAARERVESQFTVTHMVDKYEKLYRTVITSLSKNLL